MDLFRAFITKQMKLRMGVQGALVYGVKLLGKEGALALAFPSLAKQILDDRRHKEETKTSQEGMKGKGSATDGAGIQEGKEAGEVAGGKEGVLLQSDIRKFSAKKRGKAKEPRSTVKVSEVPRKKIQLKKDPRRLVGLETEEKRTKDERMGKCEDPQQLM